MSIACLQYIPVRRLCRLDPTIEFRTTRAAHSSAGGKLPAPIIRHGVSYYWDTVPPTAEQLKAAQAVFSAAPPQLIDSSTKFRTVKETSAPEVAFLGRSNVGKSSLLNALMGKDICHTSKSPGRTRTMNSFAIGGQGLKGDAGRLTLLDMPGYGHGSRVEWGTEIVKYLTKRKQLRRAFVLLDPRHGLKDTDEQLLSMLRQNGISHQVILSKIDRLLSTGKGLSQQRLENKITTLDAASSEMRSRIQPGLADGPEALGEIICCCALTRINGQYPGISSLRWAVLAATGLGT